MIKYPRKGQSIPHERVFTMDFENLVYMHGIFVTQEELLLHI